MTERSIKRAVIRTVLGIAQIGLVTATVAAWSQQGMSRAVITLGALTAAAVVASFIVFRQER